MKKSVILALALISLVSLSIVGVNLVASQYNLPDSIHIKADGSIEPTTAPIEQAGDVYTFVGNITGRLIVEKDSITIDASGYSINDGGLGYVGIFLTDRTSITVEHANSPILLENTSSCTIAENSGAIYLKNSSNNRIMNNSITPPYNATHDGLPVASDGLTIQNSHDNSIYANYISANMRSINLSNSTNNAIYENTIIKGGMIGIYLQNSTNNAIIKNNIIDNAKQVEGWNSYPNVWDNGTVGNYWSDNNGNSTYAIKITLLTNMTTVYDYDYHAQPHPYALNTIAEPTPSPTVTPLATPEPTTQLTATPQKTPSASPLQEPTATLQPQQVSQTEVIYIIAGAVVIAVVALVLVAMRRRR